MDIEQDISRIEKLGKEFEASTNSTVRKLGKNLQTKIIDIKEGLIKLKSENSTLSIGVVGQVKAGKSSILNALFFDGETVLPKAATPMTAGLTVLLYGEKEEVEIEYYNEAEWNDFKNRAEDFDAKVNDYRRNNPQIIGDEFEIAHAAGVTEEEASAKELVKEAGGKLMSKVKRESLKERLEYSGKKELESMLANYVGVGGQYTPIVKCLTIYLRDPRLKDIRLVDTPGVNDPVQSREMKTRQFLRESHGILLLSSSSRFFDATDMSFLTERISTQGIGTVVTIASKFDDVILQEGLRWKGDFWGCQNACQEELTRHFKRNIQSSGWMGREIELDFCSGLCYSLSQKNIDNYDKVEKHVLGRLQQLFPEIFGNSLNLNEDDKDTLRDFSRVEIIQKDLINGLFKENKEKIISQKCHDYLTSSHRSLSDEVKRQKQLLIDQIECLRTTDFSNISIKKAALEKVKKEIELRLYMVLESIDITLENNKKKIVNETAIKEVQVPKTEQKQWYVRRSTFWGRNRSFDVTYQKVDEMKMIEKFCNEIKRAFNDAHDLWFENIQSLPEKLDKELSKLIIDIQYEDKDGKIDMYIIRKLIAECINALTSNKEFNCTEIVDKLNLEVCNSIQGISHVKYEKACESESEAREKVMNNAEDKLRKAKQQAYNLTLIINNEIKIFIEDIVEQAKRDLKNRGDKFKKSLDVQVGSIIEELCSQLKEKNKELELMKNAVESLIIESPLKRD